MVIRTKYHLVSRQSPEAPAIKLVHRPNVDSRIVVSSSVHFLLQVFTAPRRGGRMHARSCLTALQLCDHFRIQVIQDSRASLGEGFNFP